VLTGLKPGGSISNKSEAKPWQHHGLVVGVWIGVIVEECVLCLFWCCDGASEKKESFPSLGTL